MKSTFSFSFYYVYLIIPVSWIAEAIATANRSGGFLLFHAIFAVLTPCYATLILLRIRRVDPLRSKQIRNRRFALYAAAVPLALLVLTAAIWPLFSEESLSLAKSSLNGSILAGWLRKIVPLDAGKTVLLFAILAIPVFFFSEMGWVAISFREMSEKHNDRLIAIFLGFLRGLQFLPVVIFSSTLYTQNTVRETALRALMWLVYSIITMIFSVRICINSGRLFYCVLFRVLLYYVSMVILLMDAKYESFAFSGTAPFGVIGLSVMAFLCLINEIMLELYARKERFMLAGKILRSDIRSIYRSTARNCVFAKDENDMPKRSEIMDMLNRKSLYILRKGADTEGVITVIPTADSGICELKDINVSFEFQSKGVGRRLLNETEKELKKQGYSSVRATIISVNLAAYRILLVQDYYALYEKEIGGSIYITFEKKLQ